MTYVYTAMVPQVAQKHMVHITGVASIQTAVTAEVKRQSGKNGSTVHTAQIERFRG
jgi:ActR/RegA family two-component response regulator